MVGCLSAWPGWSGCDDTSTFGSRSLISSLPVVGNCLAISTGLNVHLRPSSWPLVSSHNIMDPVTILSLVCNICQLCEYGAAALVTAKKVYDSETGLTDQHEKLQSSTKSLGELMGRLQLSC
ncbi:hypothetical protein DL98DRAFT_53476 [Cadophora sp. DSE1049]|nr:hypothetical protein DL98DRAFT_53476 [Cadophora sp. DSE1049]